MRIYRNRVHRTGLRESRRLEARRASPRGIGEVHNTLLATIGKSVHMRCATLGLEKTIVVACYFDRHDVRPAHERVWRKPVFLDHLAGRQVYKLEHIVAGNLVLLPVVK